MTSNPLKVLLCKNGFAGPLSGADEIVVNYAVELKAAGHSPGVLLVHCPAHDDPFAARLAAAGVSLQTLASPTFTSSLATARKLAIRAMRTFTPARNLIRSNSRKVVFDLLQRYHGACCEFLRHTRPDIIHVLTPDPGAVMLIRAASVCGIPVVYQEVGIPFHPPGFEEVYERFTSVLPLCAGVAALSPALARELCQAVPQVQHTHVLPLITPDHNGASASRTSQPVTFGFAARLEYLKGPMPFVAALRIAHDSQPNIAARIAGEGSQRKEVVDFCRNFNLADKCQLVGIYQTLQDRNEFMHGIDVFVLPSLTEGTPNAIIEAMSHAKPIIATAIGGVPDFVGEDVGILVPPNDVNALAGAMSRLAGDEELRTRLGLAARKKYEQLFSPGSVLPLLVDFYERIIARHAAKGNGSAENKQRSHPWSN
ncbi:MAG TPA: glycosyltransferase family 4 protein [Pyrinomonadaceae bacterium]|nr:glycosyltransferase family 4 protein [Pyrinomonadaceae bacterium]